MKQEQTGYLGVRMSTLPLLGVLLCALTAGCASIAPQHLTALPELAPLPPGLGDVYSYDYTADTVHDPAHGIYVDVSVQSRTSLAEEEATTVTRGMADHVPPGWMVYTNYIVDGELHFPASETQLFARVVVRLKYCEETLVHAATNRSLPSTVRYPAMIESICADDLPAEQSMLLVRACVTDSCSAIRAEALRHAISNDQLDHNNELAVICIRSLRDPCLDVATAAAIYISDFLRLEHWSRGGSLPGGFSGCYSGPPHYPYIADLYYLLGVATRLNKAYPTLFTDAELAKLLKRRTPSDTVLRHLGIQSNSEGRDYFEAEYLRYTKNL